MRYRLTRNARDARPTSPAASRAAIATTYRPGARAGSRTVAGPGPIDLLIVPTPRRPRLIVTLGRYSLGRYLPEMRPTVAAALVQATARANAQFAALSNLPAVIPVGTHEVRIEGGQVQVKVDE